MAQPAEGKLESQTFSAIKVVGLYFFAYFMMGCLKCAKIFRLHVSQKGHGKLAEKLFCRC